MDDAVATAPPGNFVKEHNARHIWHPMGDPRTLAGEPPLIVARGEGVRVFDAEGHRYMDCTAALWNVNVGHNRPEIKQAITEQLDRIAYYSSFHGYTNAPSIELSAKLMEMMVPEDMARVMFSSGGSDANETAFKLVRQYWRLVGKPEKMKIFSLKFGYHGVHYGGASASGGLVHRRAYEPLVPGFFQVDSPYLYRNPWTEDPEELARICAAQLEREIQFHGADTVAAFVAEPVQGAGGMIVPPENYWPLIREVCDRNDVLLIADEVVTGFGRTGSMFGARGWGVKPDIMCLAKGINSGYVPLGATVFNHRIAEAWDAESPLRPIMHGYTYSGHAVACAAALANLKIVEDENLPENARVQGAYFLERLRPLKERFSCVGDVRGRGLMLCIEFVKDRDNKTPFAPTDPFVNQVVQACRGEGMLVRVMNSRLLLSPPLIVTRDDVDEMVEGLTSGIAAAESA